MSLLSLWFFVERWFNFRHRITPGRQPLSPSSLVRSSKPVHGELQIHGVYSSSAPARKFGPENSLAIYHLLPTNSAFSCPDAQHTFGPDHPGLPHQINPLHFFSLLPGFQVGHPSHKRVVWNACPSKPANSYKYHGVMFSRVSDYGC